MKSLFFLTLAGTLCLAGRTSFKIKQSISAPSDWEIQGAPPRDHPITLRIGLSQPNIDVLEQHLLQISDPDHPRYGQHLMKEEVEGIVAPHPESVRLVDGWLAEHGVKAEEISRSPARDWVIVAVRVELAEKLLNTTYKTWRHTRDGGVLVRTTSYGLPAHLHSHIDVVQPTTAFARWGAMRSTIYTPKGDVNKTTLVPEVATNSKFRKSCGGGVITVECLMDLYSMKGYRLQKPRQNSIAVTGYLEEFANKNDLQQFYREQRPDAVGSSFQLITANGGTNNQDPSKAGLEANLDTQFAFGLTFPTRSVYYSTGGKPPFKPDRDHPNNTNEPYAEWLDFVLGHSSPPLVISTSYGDHEQTVPPDYARRTCQQLMQLGARGVSLLFASGDDGVGDGISDPNSHHCQTNDGQNRHQFLPLFPASCPYVTAVGGTTNVPEVGVSFSGGGFSNYFKQPSYQTKAVSGYLGKLPRGLYQGLFNPAGRAIPDVSAQAQGYRVVKNGQFTSVGGTSASAPTFAAVVALLNDVRLAAGGSPLGFLNPLLYSRGFNGLNDIRRGNNPGCGTNGFSAAEGWDPVTGLGTPDFEKLKRIVLG